jgi:phosphoribosylformylglycinamidine cyclo-ligase
VTTPTTYRSAGVDREAAREAKHRILDLLTGTATAHVVANPGGFGGLCRVPQDIHEPLLVSSADGVGTKLKVAMLARRHDTIGRDLVNHCANDILVEGARPLFFLDYIGMGALEPGTAEQIVTGVAEGCIENNCALLGGETAELPDFYAPGEYDLAGFIVGVVGAQQRLGAHRVQKGDVLLGLGSSGFHTNGYSLARKVLFEKLKLSVDDVFPEGTSSVADVLLRVHRSYLASIQQIADSDALHALAHITGGGIPENLDRVIPVGLCARIERKSWRVPAEFMVIRSAGDVPLDDMERTFNMGIGMIAVVAPGEANAIAQTLRASGEVVHTIGEITTGDVPVRVEG